MKSFPSIFVTVFFILGSIFVYAQEESAAGYEKIHYNGDKEQTLKSHLAVAKLCIDTEYDKILGSKRTKTMNAGELVDGERLTSSNACARIIPYPFVNPLEYYSHKYLGDQSIASNQSNVFKIKKLRSELIQNHQSEYNSLLDASDTENLISYNTVMASIQDYDFGKQQLRLSYSLQLPDKINEVYKVTKYVKSVSIPKLSEGRHSFYACFIDMPEAQAEKIYNYYSENDKYQKNPPYKLNSKITYAIRLHEEEGEPKYFQYVVKKIEFYVRKSFDHMSEYITDDAKIGEVSFDETIYKNERLRYVYQLPKE